MATKPQLNKLKQLINKKEYEQVISYLSRVNLNNEKIISAIEDKIIKTKKLYLILKFLNLIDGASLKKAEDAIIKANNSKYIYQFARDMQDVLSVASIRRCGN